MEGIVQLSSSATTKHHALCLFLLDKLAENIGSILISNLDTIMGIILPFLHEKNELNNRILAAQALCSVLFEVQTLTPNLCDSLKLLPPIILQAVAEHEDLLLQDMLQNMSRLSNERPELFINSWDTMFRAIQILCENPDIEGGSKVCALQVMITLITAKKSSFCSIDSSRRECLRLCIRLMTAVDEDDEAVSSHSRPESEGTVRTTDHLHCQWLFFYCSNAQLSSSILLVLMQIWRVDMYFRSSHSLFSITEIGFCHSCDFTNPYFLKAYLVSSECYVLHAIIIYYNCYFFIIQYSTEPWHYKIYFLFPLPHLHRSTV